MAATVFYSFHYKRDVARVQLIQKINSLEGQPLLNAQDWETVRRDGDAAVEKWISEQMAYKRAVVVLIGQETAERPWVQYEIEKAWRDKRALLGVRIHGVSAWGETDRPGPDPFKAVGIPNRTVPIFDPTVSNIWGVIDSKATYANISNSIVSWATQGYKRP